MQGFKVGVAYNVTDYAVFAATGYITWNLTERLYGGAANSPSNLGAGIAHVNAVNTLELDLNVQF